jgi:multisubunit Na+/H+ antiporter MnhC subunit
MSDILIFSLMVFGIAMYTMAMKRNLMKMAISIAMLSLPALILFAESGNEVMGLAVIAIESCSLAILLLMARYIWRFMATEEVGNRP